MAALARWCVRHRLVVVLLWLVALGGATAAAAVAGSAYSDDYEVPGTESGRATRLLQEGFPGLGGDTDTVVWRTAPGTVRAADVEQTMSRTLDRIAALPGVAAVGSPYQGRGADRISRDGHIAYATVTFERPAEEITRPAAQAVVTTAEAARTEGLQVELGGSAIGLTKSSGGHLAESVGVAVAAVVLLLAFGSPVAALLPIATALVSVGTAYAAVELLGHAMAVADFAPMLGLLVGLGVGIDYALFVVTRHRRGLKRGLDTTESVTGAVATTGRAVVFAGATVCLALLGMLILRLGFLDGVAVAASLTVLLTVAAAVTLLPALLSYAGPRVLSRRERRRLAEHGPEPELPTGLAARWSAFVERRPKLLGALALAVVTLLAVPTLSLRLGTSDQGNDPASSTTRRAYDLLAEGFGPGVNGPLTLVTRVDGAEDRLALDNLDTVLRGTEGVAAVTPVTYTTGGGTACLTVIPDSAPQSQRTSDLVGRLRTEVLPRAESGTSLDVHVGGVTAGYDDFAGVIVGRLPLFVGVVVGLGGVLLLLAFRSLGIPLKAAAMNVAAVAAAFGVVVVIFQWGWGSEQLGLGRAGPIEPFLPVIMVSVLFGLSMDYQVFLVSRMYEEWLETGDNRRAVRVGLAETSRVINSAAVIMISVFLAFVLSGDRVIAMFGIALAAAVALDAFVLRTLLVPALMHLLGGANWWLPRRLDRILPRISIEPPECRAAHERLAEAVDVTAEEQWRDVRDIPG
ncbi:MMPL family transporter [Streptomyces tropicalis]|uniref:MMPL family transporter n=1 Tax=Streptomyces tropicalis TaxID=3034234 RepID=A0ABT6ACT5_9ACTN|nr:MMPL family transporter [Streptomyces tropicalis]MDF3302460.1 MMPL family transporter [Streptomyces tropicalis]